jgi:hypothetical protein
VNSNLQAPVRMVRKACNLSCRKWKMILYSFLVAPVHLKQYVWTLY